MKKFIFILIIFSLLLVAGYTYFQKFTSYKFTTEYSLQDAKDFLAEQGTTVSVLEENQTGVVTNSEKVEINTELNQSLATALANYWSSSWIYAPLVDSNIRINSDNTVEYYGTFDLNRALNYAKATGISQSVVDTVSNYIKPFGSKFPIYAKGTIEITNNNVVASVQDAKVSIASITGLVNKYQSEINSFVTGQLSQDSKYIVRTLKVDSNKFVFDGDLPKLVEYK